MKYYFTDFFRWEQPLIDQLRKEGKFVYSVIDTGGIHYSIVYRGIVNRYGFLITDEDILADCDDDEMNDVQFESLNGMEDRTLKETKKDMTEALRKSKEEYDSKEEEREASWQRAIELQDNINERTMHYKLYYPYEDRQRHVLSNGDILRLQFITDNKDGTQEVTFFIVDSSDDKITVNADINTKYNARLSTIVKQIDKKYEEYRANPNKHYDTKVGNYLIW